MKDRQARVPRKCEAARKAKVPDPSTLRSWLSSTAGRWSRNSGPERNVASATGQRTVAENAVDATRRDAKRLGMHSHAKRGNESDESNTASGLGFNFGRFSSSSFDRRLDSGSPQAPPGMTVSVGRRSNQNRASRPVRLRLGRIWLSALLCLLGLLWLLPGNCGSVHADMIGFRISQVFADLPELAVYADIRDMAGEVAATPAPSDFTATVGPLPALVETVAPFERTGLGVAYILLVDISKSIKPGQFLEIRRALNKWVDAMTEKDRAAVVSFGDGVSVACDFTQDRQRLRDTIEKLSPTDGRTCFYQTLLTAMDLGRRQDEGLPGRKVVVTLSDGKNDVEDHDGLTARDVFDAIDENKVPVYAIGFGGSARNAAKDPHLQNLAEFSRKSGGGYFRAENMSFDDMYDGMREKIRQVFFLGVRCESCVADGREHRLHITWNSQGRVTADGVDFRPLPQVSPFVSPSPGSPETEQLETQEPSAAAPRKRPQPVFAPPPITEFDWRQTFPLAVYGFAGAAVLLLVFLLLFGRLGKKRKYDSEGQLEEDAGERQAGPQSSVLEPGPETDGQVETSAGKSGKQRQASPLEESLGTAVGPSVVFRLVAIGDRPVSCEAVLRDRIVIGRQGGDCDLALEGDPTVSRSHCEISLERGRVFVRHLGGINPTFVNGAPALMKQVLEDGDKLRIGAREFRARMSKL